MYERDNRKTGNEIERNMSKLVTFGMTLMRKIQERNTHDVDTQIAQSLFDLLAECSELCTFLVLDALCRLCDM